MIIAFLGKGGVGKTTISTAFALELSKGYKVALISTDAIPMTRRILNEKVPGLDVFEYTEYDVRREWKNTYGEEVYSLISSFFDIDKSIIDHIANAPGIDDEFMMAKLLEMNRSYNYIIWDTAASSSTIHLLLLEKEFYEHISNDIKFYLSIKETLSKIMKRNANPLEILGKWKKLAEDVWDLLKFQTEYYIVKTDDELSYLQGKIIEDELKEMGLTVQGHILNRSRGKYECEIKIPDFQGNAREIVEMVRPFVRNLRKR